jgi:hypothetical protein
MEKEMQQNIKQAHNEIRSNQCPKNENPKNEGPQAQGPKIANR